MRVARAALGLVLAGFVLVATAVPVAADARDVDQGIGLPFFPCREGAPIASFSVAPGTADNEGTFARICFVNIFGSGWQAQTGEWILFRVAWVTQTPQQCAQFLAKASVMEEFRSSPVTPDVLPCQQRPAGDWAALLVFVTRPLPPGAYSNTFTITINAELSDGLVTYPAGTVLAFTSTVKVVPGG